MKRYEMIPLLFLVVIVCIATSYALDTLSTGEYDLRLVTIFAVTITLAIMLCYYVLEPQHMPSIKDPP